MAPVNSNPAEGLNGAVAAELRAERAAQNMTIAALSVTSGIPEVSLQRYLKGERHIDMTVLADLAVALGKDPNEIVTLAVARMERNGEPLAANRGDIEPADQ